MMVLISIGESPSRFHGMGCSISPRQMPLATDSKLNVIGPVRGFDFVGICQARVVAQDKPELGHVQLGL